MAKVAKTAYEIHDEVPRLVHEIPAVLEDGEPVQVGYPIPLADAQDGPNWTIENVTNGRAYLRAIREVITEAQQRWDLKT